MKIDINEPNIVLAICQALNAIHEEDAVSHSFTFTTEDYDYATNEFAERRLVAKISRRDLNALVAKVRGKDIVNETIMHSDRDYEVLIRDESPIGGRRLPRKEINIEDSEHSMKYHVAQATEEYLLFLLLSLFNADLLSSFSTRLSPSFESAEDRNTAPEFPSPLLLLRQSFGRFRTLRLESAKTKSLSEFAKFADSFVFQISYNMETALVQQRSLDEVNRVGRLARCKRLQINEIAGPQRSYITSLVYHYQLAIAADNPFLQYLSYYHIAEHFFEEAFREELVSRITDRITRPDFSHRRRKDVQMLVREIAKSTSVRSDSLIKSEQEALRLTLLKFVNIPELLLELQKYDPSLIVHYGASGVKFAGAENIDLQTVDNSLVYKLLAARIYKIRNSLARSQ